VPGAPASSLASAANAHPSTDVILIGADVAESDLNGAWFYVPRMLHENSIVLAERHEADGRVNFNRITRSQIGDWAARESVRRAA
jgi:hypothetical protein